MSCLPGVSKNGWFVALLRSRSINIASPELRAASKPSRHCRSCWPSLARSVAPRLPGGCVTVSTSLTASADGNWPAVRRRCGAWLPPAASNCPPPAGRSLAWPAVPPGSARPRARRCQCRAGPAADPGPDPAPAPDLERDRRRRASPGGPCCTSALSCAIRLSPGTAS